MTKLTYPMYLVQFMVITHISASARQGMYFTNNGVLQRIITVTVYCTFLSILVSAFIERPFATLVEMLLPKKKMAVTPNEESLVAKLLGNHS